MGRKSPGKRLIRSIFALIGAVLAWSSLADHTPWDELLPPEDAFRLTTQVINASSLEARWAIADGYYMYRDKFRFEALDPSVSVGSPELPPGAKKTDPYFGTTEIYTGVVTARVPLVRHDKSVDVVRVRITSQGCNEPIGVCYPPHVTEIDARLSITESAPAKARSGSITNLKDLAALLRGESPQQPFLHPDEAFVLTLEPQSNDALLARFLIAEGYYLYREKTGFSVEPDNGSAGAALALGTVQLPPGESKVDEYFGETVVYYGGAEMTLPLVRRGVGAVEAVVNATYQGCADKGICYPPIKKRFRARVGTDEIILTALDSSSPVDAGSPIIQATAGVGARSVNTFLIAIATAFGTGLLLTFTPCVLPMIPIISSIIVGQRKTLTTSKAALLSVTYVLGTAVTYAAIGAVAGATGDQLQAYFQTPWAIGLLSALFVAMALSMFGFYELQMPSFIQSRLQHHSQTIRGSSVIAVFFLGLVSALIVGACVSPLLISALSVAIAGQDPLLGAVMMFSMALGMGVVLIAAGVGVGSLAPKAGPWMDRVKHVFGVLLLAVAIYLLGFVPGVPVLILWSALLIVVAVYLGATQSLPKAVGGWRYLWKGLGTLLLIWGVLALIGGLAGNRDILRPLPYSVTSLSNALGIAAAPQTVSHPLFERITSPVVLEQRLRAAREAGQPVMLDYYADWCTDCLRMERSTFADPQVRAMLLDRFVLLQADVTNAFDPGVHALKQRFHVYGPPATLFFAPTGEEREDLRFYGYRSADDFMQILRKASGSATTVQART
ncbi:MAG: protein-disulfide reductase DsbD [Acidiferrobacterales bacterium]